MHKKIVFISLLFIFLFIGFKANALSEKGYKHLHSFAEVLHQVEENYVESIDEKRLISGAIRGMLMTLDPHTIYMPPDVYRELKIEATGRFGGIGIEVTIKKGWLTIVSPIEGSPAFQVGVKPGDRIVRVNGVSTKGVTLSEAVAMMRGRVGTKVSLTLTRKGKKHPFDVRILRKVIKVPSVTVENLGEGYFYAKISTFQERTAAELKSKLKKISADNIINGLVIDLRNNPGGLLSQAIDVADLFVDNGVIVSTRSRDQEIAKYDAKRNGTYSEFPIVILVNGGSASASEILAGALKDYGKAVIVGTQSFGKGSVQSVLELDDGSALKITIAKYYTPSGHSIQGFGIVPNIILEQDEDSGFDEQKIKAIEYLKDDKKYRKALRGSKRKRRR